MAEVAPRAGLVCRLRQDETVQGVESGLVNWEATSSSVPSLLLLDRHTNFVPPPMCHFYSTELVI